MAVIIGFMLFGCSALVCAAELPDNSLYHFKQEWTNQFGKKQSLESLRGKVRVFAMIYTQCKSACPLIVESMKKIQRQLPPESSEKVGFVLFSMDPKRDSPSAMANFVKAHGIEKDHWLLLTSDKDNVQELTAAIAFNFKESSSGDFIHQNTIFVLNADGVVMHQYPNLDEAVSDAVKALSESPYGDKPL